ncbi:MAG TPA: hypothetical protein VFY02_05265 [Gaiellaceae bacterium]|nr:hypothetical protein [Gaiellaceae bacterium]
MHEGTSRPLRLSGMVGTLAFACLAVLAPATAAAAAPSPDPPPLAVTPEPPEAAAAEPAPAVTRTVVTSSPGPVVTRTVVTPVIVTREVPARPSATPTGPRAKPKPKPKAAVKAAVTPKPKPATEQPSVARTPQPHDRHPVPLARFVPSAEELNRGLVALAGGGLALVALGGGVLLLAARRQFGELAR